MPRSGNNCCVVGCYNTRANKDIKFHKFPSKPWETERRAKWVRAIKRLNPDGTPWVPASHSLVCSAHFIGGKISNIESHPAYIPSIFPAVYGKRTAKEDAKLSRFNRAIKRRKMAETRPPATKEETTNGEECKCNTEAIHGNEVGHNDDASNDNKVEVIDEVVMNDDEEMPQHCSKTSIQKLLQVNRVVITDAEEVPQHCTKPLKQELQQANRIVIKDAKEMPQHCSKTSIQKLQPVNQFVITDGEEVPQHPSKQKLHQVNQVVINGAEEMPQLPACTKPLKQELQQVNRIVIKDAKEMSQFGSKPSKQKLKQNAAVQVYVPFATNKFEFSSVRIDSTTIQTQCCTDVSRSFEKKDASWGTENDLQVCHGGFHGFASLEKSEPLLKSVTGTSRKSFDSLLEKIPKSAFTSLTPENALVLFLMKEETGLSLTALGALFNVARTTASRACVKIREALRPKALMTADSLSEGTKNKDPPTDGSTSDQQ